MYLSQLPLLLQYYLSSFFNKVSSIKASIMFICVIILAIVCKHFRFSKLLSSIKQLIFIFLYLFYRFSYTLFPELMYQHIPLLAKMFLTEFLLDFKENGQYSPMKSRCTSIRKSQIKQNHIAADATGIHFQ